MVPTKIRKTKRRIVVETAKTESKTHTSPNKDLNKEKTSKFYTKEQSVFRVHRSKRKDSKMD